MQYSFDLQEAVDYGVDESIMIWNLRFWIIKNKANGRHLYAGDDKVVRTWTYNTIPAFLELFPFWKTDAMRRIIASLTKQEVVIKGNFNSNPYDKTTWYAFKDEAKFLAPHLVIAHVGKSPDRSRDFPTSKRGNQNIDDGNPHIGGGKTPASNTDLKPDIKPFLSLLAEEKREFLKKEFWDKLKLKSSLEKYCISKARNNWKGFSNLEADVMWWENGFLELNPQLKKSAKIAKSEAPEIKTLRNMIESKLSAKSVDYFTFFSGKPVEKTDIGYKIIVSDPKALKYEEALKKIVKIEVKNA